MQNLTALGTPDFRTGVAWKKGKRTSREPNTPTGKGANPMKPTATGAKSPLIFNVEINVTIRHRSIGPSSPIAPKARATPTTDKVAIGKTIPAPRSCRVVVAAIFRASLPIAFTSGPRLEGERLLATRKEDFESRLIYP
jgi:hypothetical protein